MRTLSVVPDSAFFSPEEGARAEGALVAVYPIHPAGHWVYIHTDREVLQGQGYSLDALPAQEVHLVDLFVVGVGEQQERSARYT